MIHTPADTAANTPEFPASMRGSAAAGIIDPEIGAAIEQKTDPEPDSANDPKSRSLPTSAEGVLVVRPPPSTHRDRGGDDDESDQSTDGRESETRRLLGRIVTARPVGRAVALGGFDDEVGGGSIRFTGVVGDGEFDRVLARLVERR